MIEPVIRRNWSKKDNFLLSQNSFLCMSIFSHKHPLVLQNLVEIIWHEFDPRIIRDKNFLLSNFNEFWSGDRIVSLKIHCECGFDQTVLSFILKESQRISSSHVQIYAVKSMLCVLRLERTKESCEACSWYWLQTIWWITVMSESHYNLEISGN